MRTMQSERLRLVPVTPQTAPTLWGVLQLPDLREFQDLPNVGSAAFMQMVSKRPKVLRPGTIGRFEWLVYLERVRKPLGWVSLRVTEREGNAGEIGYSIIREFRGQGIATEAVRLMISEAFDQARLARICAYCVPENTASRRVLERLGFREERLVPAGASVAGRSVDVLLHVMDREHWKVLSSAENLSDDRRDVPVAQPPR